MPQMIVNVAKDFSRYPAGRFKSDGPFSGQHFREDILIPRLRQPGNLTVELDGTRGYGSSFLEEAFGGLIRAGLRKEELFERLILLSGDDSIVAEIMGYMEDASGHSQGKG